MSIFENQSIACPGCSAELSLAVAHSVNADRRPDLRQAIIDGSFQSDSCPHCGASFRREPRLNYLDFGRRLWVLAEPAGEVADWPGLEARAQAIFDLAYGASASAPAQQLGRELTMRVVFGWPALREKIVAGDAGLDDVALECLKLTLMRALDGPPLADGVELRLHEADALTLAFVWVDADGEKALETLVVPRTSYDSVAAAAAGFDELRATLAAGPFVDVNRVLVEPAEAAG